MSSNSKKWNNQPSSPEAYGENFLLVKGGNASLKKLLTNPLLKNHTSFIMFVNYISLIPTRTLLHSEEDYQKPYQAGNEDIRIFWLWRHKLNKGPTIKKYESNCFDLFEGISVQRFLSVFQVEDTTRTLLHSEEDYQKWRHKLNSEPMTKKYQSDCVDLFEGISVHRFLSVFRFEDSQNLNQTDKKNKSSCFTCSYFIVEGKTKDG